MSLRRAKIHAPRGSRREQSLRDRSRDDEADQEIVLLLNRGRKIADRNGVFVQESTNDLQRLCKELRGYAQNNRDSIINYHRRYHDKQPVSCSQAEGCVDEIASARMGKKQRMRWSPRGAHRGASHDGTVHAAYK